MTTTYIIGTLGDAGSPIMGSAKRFEPLPDDDCAFSTLTEARKVAREAAIVFAHETLDPQVSVAVATENGDGLTLVTVATVKHGGRRVRWI